MERIDETPRALNDRDLARPGHAGQPARELADYAVFIGTQLVEVDLRLAKGNAVCSKAARLFEHGNAVQQGFGRNAPDVQAYAAQRGVAFDQHHIEPEVGGAEGRRIPAGART